MSTISDLFEGAKGTWAVINVVMFLLGGATLYYGMKEAVGDVQAVSMSNSDQIDKILLVIQKQNDRQIELERKQAVITYQLAQDADLNRKQTEQLEHQTKVLERIAAKLQVRTD